MAEQVEEHFLIQDFQGLGNPFAPKGDMRRVRSMTNLHARFGRLFGREGFTALKVAAAFPVVGLHDLKKVDGTVSLLRVFYPSASTIGADSITGTGAWTTRGTAATNGSDNADYVDFVVHNNNLYFVAKAANSQYKWTGAGNIALEAAAPQSHLIASFGGYILAGRAAGGTLLEQTIRYDNADNGATWPAANVINAKETPGALMKMLPLGKTLWCYTTAGATLLRFVGTSLTVFSQDRANTNIGLLASATAHAIPGIGHLLQGTDGRVYINDGSLVQPVLTDLNNTLLAALNLSSADKSYASVDEFNSTYSLFFPGTGSTTPNKRLDFNYQTGAFVIHSYSSGFSPVYYSKYVSGGNVPGASLVGAISTATHTIDSGSTDNGTGITYEWESDWVRLEDKDEASVHTVQTLQKIDLVFDVGSKGKVHVAVAKDFDPEFLQEKILDLTPLANQSTDVKLTYAPQPMKGHWFNIRLRFYPKATGSDIKLTTLIGYVTRERVQVSPLAYRV